MERSDEVMSPDLKKQLVKAGLIHEEPNKVEQAGQVPETFGRRNAATTQVLTELTAMASDTLPLFPVPTSGSTVC